MTSHVKSPSKQIEEFVKAEEVIIMNRAEMEMPKKIANLLSGASTQSNSLTNLQKAFPNESPIRSEPSFNVWQNLDREKIIPLTKPRPISSFKRYMSPVYDSSPVSNTNLIINEPFSFYKSKRDVYATITKSMKSYSMNKQHMHVQSAKSQVTLDKTQFFKQ